MKQSFKSLISILTVATMIVAMMPTAMAANTIPGSLPATVTVFRNGVTDATANASVLTDGFYYLGDSVITGKSYAFDANKVITFNRETENSGIMWSFDEVTPVKRIDLWVLQIGAIGEYVIETRNSDEESWKTVHTGTLDMYDEFNDPKTASNSRFYTDTTGNTRSSYFPVILPQNISAKDIRFRIVSFPTSIKDNGTQINTAYIAEAKIYNTNEINLGYKNSSYKSPYIYSLFMTTGNNKYYSGSTQAIWSSGGLKPSNNKLSYGTAFGYSNVKINKIIPQVSAGTITEIKIYTATDNHLYNGLAITEKPSTHPLDLPAFSTSNTSPSGTQSWTNTPVTISCNITKDTPEEDRTFYIPDAVASSPILFDFVYDPAGESPVVSDIEMYSLADYELIPDITKAEFSGTVAAGETVTLNLATRELTNETAKVYFAVYSGKELKSAAAVACPLTGTASYTRSYTIPADAGENLTLKAFVWDGLTLVPLLATPVVAGE